MIVVAWLAVQKFFSSLWGFLGTPLGSWVLRLSICIALLVCGELHGFSRGVTSEKLAEAKRLEAAKKVVKKVEAKATEITTKTDERVAKREVEIRTVTKTLLKEVKVYVSPEIDRRYLLPNSAIWLHDQAALGVSEVPAHPGQLPDAPSGVPLSAFTETIVSNYGTGLEWKEAALACHSWVNEQAANFNANIDTARP